MVTDFWRKSAKIGIPCLHPVSWNYIMDERIRTRMHALTPPKTFVRLMKMWWTFLK